MLESVVCQSETIEVLIDGAGEDALGVGLFVVGPSGDLLSNSFQLLLNRRYVLPDLLSKQLETRDLIVCRL